MRGLLGVFLFAGSAAAQGLWERRADYPIEATEVSAAAIGGRIYAVCGLTTRGSVTSLYIYDPRLDSWSEGAPAPIAGGADHCNVAAAGGKFYLAGAIRIGSSFIDGNTYEYDPASDRWTTVGRMNVPRGASGVAAIGARIYVAGGLSSAGSVADFEVFDTVTRQWTRLPNMPTARDHLTAQAAGGRFYAIAGRAGQEFTANEEYDPVANAWTRRAPIPTRRGGLGSGTIGGRIQVFGGEGASGTPEGTYRQNEEYDPVADAWRSLAPMPTPRHGLYGATLDDRLFTPSGGPRAGGFFSNVHEAFYLPPAEPPRIAPAGARNAASFSGELAAGSIVALFGERFSFGEQVATRFPLPTQMNAVVVRVNGTPAPLFYVGPGQINFALPYDLATAPPSIVVSNAGSESVPAAANLLEFAPALFSVSVNGRGQGAILISGTNLVAGAAGRAARKNDVVEIYCTGLGRLTNPPPPGQPATGVVRTAATPIVTIGGAIAEVLFSGLAPGLAGVYQINARVPQASVTSAAVPVTVRMATGPVSNLVTIAVID